MGHLSDPKIVQIVAQKAAAWKWYPQTCSDGTGPLWFSDVPVRNIWVHQSLRDNIENMEIQEWLRWSFGHPMHKRNLGTNIQATLTCSRTSKGNERNHQPARVPFGNRNNAQQGNGTSTVCKWQYIYISLSTIFYVTWCWYMLILLFIRFYKKVPDFKDIQLTW